MNPDRLAELEEQRRFLLSSIRDIEREHDVGDVDDHDFHALRDGYVARAAAVMREIENGRSSLPPKPTSQWWRRPALIVGTLAVALALGVFVARSAGQRLPGQSLTGGQAVDEIAVQLSEGRRLMNTDAASAAAARAAFERVLELEPGNAEAATYSAYLLVLDGQRAGDQQMVQDGVAGLQAAALLDESYGDPHCLLAVAGGNFLDPPDEALVTSEGARCLELNPPQEMVPMIQGLIARITGETPTTTGDDVATLLAQADAAQTAGEYADALGLYQRVLELDPGNLAARAYSGYLVALNGRDSGNTDQVSQGLELMQTVADRNPDYADAHCLLALASHYFVDEPDDQLTQTEGEQCLALDAPADVVPFVQTVLDEVAGG